jgi:hypothetical protein
VIGRRGPYPGACSWVLRLCKIKTPDIVQKSAVALLLQSFYNGIENILKIIVKHFDAKLPNGSKWHKELLDKAFEKPVEYGQIFRDETKIILNNYMSMRHFIRHTYGFKLDSKVWFNTPELCSGSNKTMPTKIWY